MSQVHDLAVIGGGINGTGIACDAAGRGREDAIAFNRLHGIGTQGDSITFEANSIFDNGLLGIDAGFDGIDRPDSGTTTYVTGSAGCEGTCTVGNNRPRKMPWKDAMPRA